MKKAVIITPFDNYSYEVRIKYIERHFIDRGFDVCVLSSDFDHRNKKAYSAKRDNLELIHVPPYYKNLSFARINSHRVFAQKALKRLEELEPQLVYCSAPPNFLFKYVSQYKKKHPRVKLVYELGDLWPETLPLQKKVKRMLLPALKVWSDIRDNNIGYADGIIYECRLFYETVSKVHQGVYSDIIYLSKEDYYKGIFFMKEIPSNPLRFAYVGSINNIIDIDLIVEFMEKIRCEKDAELVIIGGGESATRLFRMCDESSIKYENHGIIYDEDEKHRILSTCQFGLNIMKKSVAVGATMKSLEYFHEGLVLINNIPADTKDIINAFNCGFNVSQKSLTDDIQKIALLTDKKIIEKRKNSRNAYEQLFSVNALQQKISLFFDSILN